MKQITHLIPATSFSLELEQNGLEIHNELFKEADRDFGYVPYIIDWKWQVNLNYARLLKRLLELGMFIPVHPVSGEVLKEPISPTFRPEQMNDERERILSRYQAELAIYQQAKEKVMFEGFEIETDMYYSVKREIIYLTPIEQLYRKLTYENGKIETYFITHYPKYNIIEDLIQLKLKLTPSALKEIYNT